MKGKEIREIIKALDVLNKYRNFFHRSSDEKEIKISQMINELMEGEDELSLIVAEKINQGKDNGGMP